MIKPVLIKSLEMKRPFMVWIGFISICYSKVAKEGKSCPRLLVLQSVAQTAKSCSKVAEHNLFMPNRDLEREIKNKGDSFFAGKATWKFCRGGEKMRNPSGHQWGHGFS